jgi:predicted homoserine dehydrogenase-like protein
MRPELEGGSLAHSGTVEVVSSLQRDGSPVYRDLRWGVFVCFVAPDDYIRRCFAEYGLLTDPSGRYAALYRPYHLIGMELTISVLRVGLRGEATGTPGGFRGDVASVAKTDLAQGQALDGEGGYTVYGKLLPAAVSLAAGALPIGLAHGLRLTRPIPAGQIVRWDDVLYETTSPAVRMRRLMERTFAL